MALYWGKWRFKLFWKRDTSMGCLNIWGNNNRHWWSIYVYHALSRVLDDLDDYLGAHLPFSDIPKCIKQLGNSWGWNQKLNPNITRCNTLWVLEKHDNQFWWFQESLRYPDIELILGVSFLDTSRSDCKWWWNLMIFLFIFNWYDYMYIYI